MLDPDPIAESRVYWVKGAVSPWDFALALAEEADNEFWPPWRFIPDIHVARVRKYPDVITGEGYAYLFDGWREGKSKRGTFIATIYDPDGDYRASWIERPQPIIRRKRRWPRTMNA